MSCGITQRDDAVVAEDAVVEGRLVLVGRPARAGRRVGPVDLVSVTHVHADAVLPRVLDQGQKKWLLLFQVGCAFLSFEDYLPAWRKNTPPSW